MKSPLTQGRELKLPESVTFEQINAGRPSRRGVN